MTNHLGPYELTKWVVAWDLTEIYYAKIPAHMILQIEKLPNHRVFDTKEEALEFKPLTEFD